MKPACFAALFLTLGLVSCNIYNPSGEGSIPGDDADGFILQGERNLRDREFDSAQANFSKALAIDSTRSLAWHGLGKSYTGNLPMDSILTAFQKLTKNTDSVTNPFSSSSWSLLRQIFRPMGRMTSTYGEFIRRDSLHLTDSVISSDGDLINYTVGKTVLLAISMRVILPSNADSTDSLLLDTTSTLAQLSQKLNSVLNVDSLTKGDATSLAASLASIAIDTSTVCDSSGTCTTQYTVNDTAVEALNGKIASLTTDLTDLQSAASTLGYETDTTDTSSSSAELVSQAQDFVKSNPASVNLVRFNDRLDNNVNGCVDEDVNDGHDGAGDGFPSDYRLGVIDSQTTPVAGQLAMSFVNDSIDDSRLVDLSRSDSLLNGQYLNRGVKGTGTSAPLVYGDAAGHLEVFRKYWDSTGTEYAEKHWKRNIEWSAAEAVAAGIPVYPVDTATGSSTKGQPFTAALALANPAAKSDSGRALTTQEIAEIRLAILTVSQTDSHARWTLGRRYVGGCWMDVKEP